MHTFTSEERQRARLARQTNKTKRKDRVEDNLTPELAYSLALKHSVGLLLDPTAPAYVKNQASRTLLLAMRDAGVKPSQRDLAIVFRKLTREDSANDSADEATPPAKE